MQRAVGTNLTQSNVLAMGAHIIPPTVPPGNLQRHYPLKIHFTDYQLKAQHTPKTSQLKKLINEKILNKEFFYGIEIMAQAYTPNTTLDYGNFGPLLPVFTSIVWLGMVYSEISNIVAIEAIQLAQTLESNAVVLPHLSCYGLEEERLRQFLNLNFSNILAIRGDRYLDNQSFQYSSQLVERIRKLRGDSITIGVAGYPEGHPECKSVEEDMGNLIKKVTAGADFIITQICFSSEAIIDFIQRCRTAKIDIPIIVGIFVPDSLRMLETMLRITKIHMPPEDLAEYRQSAAAGIENDESFTEFAVRKAVQMIDAVLNSDDVDVYGLQFFSMNKFHNIPRVLKQIVNKR